MSIQAILSSPRKAALIRFLILRWRAQFDFLRARLFASLGRLDRFDAIFPTLQPGQRYLGEQAIPLGQITGSAGRSADFGRNFCPLKGHLRRRWIRIYMLSRQGEWPPIRVYKVGAQYFVEDGHHRVSVARALGLPTIQAEVWEYQPKSVRYAGACWPYPGTLCSVPGSGSSCFK